MTNLFDFVESINNSKKDLIREDNISEKEYLPFMINKHFSYFPDTVFDAQEMNERSLLPNICQYDYMRLSIRKKKRFTKWGKKNTDEFVEQISEAFNYSINKSREVLSVLTEDQINGLTAKLNKGGTTKEKVK
jgi:hypothetical protein